MCSLEAINGFKIELDLIQKFIRDLPFQKVVERSVLDAELRGYLWQ